eukprot:GHVS01104187.1.p1 GENE.GHVS01104187.1~~GHVS01104187.1.p1  ORF type:complete len:327 (+),score=15.16 GHVS01104187.1:1352-2332(+)
MADSMYMSTALSVLGWLFGESESGSDSKIGDSDGPRSHRTQSRHELRHSKQESPKNSETSMLDLSEPVSIKVVCPDTTQQPDVVSKLMTDLGGPHSSGMKSRPDSVGHLQRSTSSGDDLEAVGSAVAEGVSATTELPHSTSRNASARRSVRMDTGIKRTIQFFLRQANGLQSPTSAAGGTSSMPSASGSASPVLTQLPDTLPISKATKQPRVLFHRSGTCQIATSPVLATTIEADSNRHDSRDPTNTDATQRHKRIVTQLEHRFDFSVGDPQLSRRSRVSRGSQRRMSEGPGLGSELSRVSVVSTVSEIRDADSATSEGQSKPDPL